MKVTPATKLLILWGFVMLIIVFCTLPASRPDKMAMAGFKTAEADELYFRNVRAFYYSKTEEANGMLDVYRFKNLFADADTLPLPFAFYHNWRANECFIRLDTLYLSKPLPLLLVKDLNGTDTLTWPTRDNEAQYDFAYRVYGLLKQDNALGVSTAPGFPNALTDSERKNLRLVLKDYFKLIGKL